MRVERNKSHYSKKQVSHWPLLFSFLLGLILATPASAENRMNLGFSCTGVTSCDNNPSFLPPTKPGKQKKFTLEIQKSSGSDTGEGTSELLSTGFMKFGVTTSTATGRLTSTSNNNRNNREGLSLDTFLIFRSFFSDSYFNVLSSTSNCNDSPATPQNYNWVIFRGRSPQSISNKIYADDTSYKFAGVVTASSATSSILDGSGSIDLNTLSLDSSSYNYSLVSGASCSVNTQKLNADSSNQPLGSGASLYWGDNSFVAISRGANPNVALGIPQTNLTSQYLADLAGNSFSGMMYYQSAVSSATFKTLLISPINNGTQFNIQELTDISNTNSATSWGSLTCSDLNSPAQGFCKGTLTKSGQTGNALCAFGTVGNQGVMACTAQLPSNHAMPIFFFATYPSRATLTFSSPVLRGLASSETCSDVTITNSSGRIATNFSLGTIPSGMSLGPNAYDGQSGRCSSSIPAFSSCTVPVCATIQNAPVTTQLSISYEENATSIDTTETPMTYERAPDPVISLNADSTSGNAPFTVNFTADASVGTVSSWFWDFGDGAFDTSGAPTMSHTYSNGGSYTASVYGVDSFGQNSNSATVAITSVPSITITSISKPSSVEEINLSGINFDQVTSIEMGLTGGPLSPAWGLYQDSSYIAIAGPTSSGNYTVSLNGGAATATIDYQVPCYYSGYSDNDSDGVCSNLDCDDNNSAYTSDCSNNVVLNMNFDSNLNDSSSYNQSVGNSGNPSVSTTVAKFGGGSSYFDGSSWVTVSPAQSLAVGSRDFTIETWVFPTQLNSSSDLAMVLDTRPMGAQTGIGLWLDSSSGKWVSYISANGNMIQLAIESQATATLNSWAHLAVVRSGTSLQFFVNGQLAGTQSLEPTWDLTNDSTATVRVGTAADSPGSLRNFFGYIDELKIIKGHAKYNTNFTPESCESRSLASDDGCGCGMGAGCLTPSCPTDGWCTADSTYYINGVGQPGLDSNGTGFNSANYNWYYVNGSPFSGIYQNYCYSSGGMTYDLDMYGTGFCTGDYVFYINYSPTTLDSTGKGLWGSTYYISGTQTTLDSNGNGIWSTMSGTYCYSGGVQGDYFMSWQSTGWCSQLSTYYVNGVATSLDQWGNGIWNNGCYQNGYQTTDYYNTNNGYGWCSGTSLYYIAGGAQLGLDSSGTGFNQTDNNRYYQNGNLFSGLGSDGLAYVNGNLAQLSDGQIYISGYTQQSGWVSGSYYFNDGQIANGIMSDGHYYYYGSLGTGLGPDGYVYYVGNLAQLVDGQLSVWGSSALDGYLSGSYLFSSGRPFNGLYNGSCYSNGQDTMSLSMGSGYCAGDSTYYLNSTATTLDSSGTGTWNGQTYASGYLKSIITINTQPSNQTASGGNATFSLSVSVTNSETASYQWEKQESGSGDFSAVSGATSNTLSLSSLTDTDDNGDVYRVVVSASGGADSVTSSSASLTVPAASEGGGDEFFDDVRLLVRADEEVTNYAASGSPTVTFVGGANYSTSDKKFGTASAQLSPVVEQVCYYGCYDQITNPNYLKVNETSRTIPANYTTEFWVKPDSDWSGSTVKTMYQRGVADMGIYGINVYFYNNRIYFSLSDNSWFYDGAGEGYCSHNGTASGDVGTMSANTWHHLAIVREGSTLRLYYNGNQIGTSTLTADSYTYWGSIPECTSSGAITLSQWGEVQEVFGVQIDYGNYVYSNINAKFDDIRSSNRARYSDTSFTLSTSAYPNSKQAVAPVISLATTSHTLTAGTAMTQIVPALSSGTIDSCVVTPDLPAGLSLNSSTCGISGTPTYGGATASYTLTPSNQVGTGNSVTVSLTINGTDASGLYYSAGSIADGFVADTANDKTVLLLHMDGANGSTTFVDSSKQAISVSRNGNAVVSTAQSKFGGASGSFDSTSDYLTIQDPLNLGSGDFTVETWIYPTRTSNYTIVQGEYSGSGVLWGLHVTDYGGYRGLTFSYGQYGSFTVGVYSNNYLTQGSWNHIAVVRSGGAFSIFVNGISQTLGTYNEGNSFNPSYNFTNTTVSQRYIGNGFLDDFRITKGQAIYTSNFTPPTSALGRYGATYGCYSNGLNLSSIDASGNGLCNSTYYAGGSLGTGNYNGNYYSNGNYVSPTAVISIGDHPADQTASGGSATFSVSANITENASLSYQWQKRESGTETFTNISGATSSSLSLSSLTYFNDNGDAYRVVMNGTQGASPVTSNVATLTVVPHGVVVVSGGYGCFVQGLADNNFPLSGTGYCIDAYYVGGTVKPGLDYLGNGTSGGLLYASGALYTGLFSDGQCYLSGSDTGSVNGGTGWCYPVSIYYVSSVATNLPSSGTGNFDGNYYSGGTFISPTAVISIGQQPTDSTANGGNVTLSISASITENASINYQWQKQESGAGSFSNISGATSDTLSLSSLVYSADNGDVYRVVLTGTQGASSVTSSSATLTVPAFAPSAPTNVVGFSDDTAVILSWTAPSSNGGSAVTNYLVQYSSNGGSSWTSFSRAASASTSASVTGLTNGTNYIFKVAAVNIAGTSDYSANSSAVAPSATPGDPYFDTVRLLIHADQDMTNYATSGSPTVTFVGGANYSTSDKKFGTASAQLSPVVEQVCYYGCYDQITNPNYIKVNETSRTIPANYTTEFWVKPDSDWSGSTVKKLYQRGSVEMGLYGLDVYFYNNRIYFGVYSSSWFYDGSGEGSCNHNGSAWGEVGTMSANTWYHVAIVREGSALRLYFNGNRIGTGTLTADSYTYWGSIPECTASGAITLSSWGNVQEGFGVEFNFGDNVYSNITGKFDDIRSSNMARYSDASFTLPTRAYPNTQLAEPTVASSSACTGDCYDGAQSLDIGAERQGPDSTTLSLEYANGTSGFKIWREKNGNRILNSTGLVESGWQKTLNRAGTAFDADLTSSSVIAQIQGRVCPTHVFLSHSEMTATGRCLYYDSGNPLQALDAEISSGVEAQDWLRDWGTSATGRDVLTSYYEGNIKTCADKGMRLPTNYETTIQNPVADFTPLGDNLNPAPTPAGSTNGVPSVPGEWTWTGSASNESGDTYCFSVWDGPNNHSCMLTSFDGATPSGTLCYVRCVLPSH